MFLTEVGVPSFFCIVIIFFLNLFHHMLDVHTNILLISFVDI